jgi:hypothetical protein
MGNRKLTIAVAVFALAFAGAAALIASNASQASAGVPAICEQYPDLPQCEAPTDGGGSNPTGSDDGTAPVADEGGPTAGVGTGGDLPFTGYPLTALILLLLALLLAGLALRTYLAARDRLGGRSHRR